MPKGTANANKMVILGASDAGKSTLLERLAGGVPDPNAQPTIGGSYKELAFTDQRETQSAASECKVDTWDTAGEEKYEPIMNMMLENATIILMTFDITNTQSYRTTTTKKLAIAKQCDENSAATLFLVGNKVDLNAKRQVSSTEATDFAKENGMKYLEVSATKGTGIGLLRNFIEATARKHQDERMLDNAENHVIDIYEGELDLETNQTNCCWAALCIAAKAAGFLFFLGLTAISLTALIGAFNDDSPAATLSHALTEALWDSKGASEVLSGIGIAAGLVGSFSMFKKGCTENYAEAKTQAQGYRRT